MRNIVLSKLLCLNFVSAIQPPIPELNFRGSCRDYGHLMEKIGRLEEKIERIEKTDLKITFLIKLLFIL